MVSARFLSIAEQGRSNTSMTVSSIPSNLERLIQSKLWTSLICSEWVILNGLEVRSYPSLIHTVEVLKPSDAPQSNMGTKPLTFNVTRSRRMPIPEVAVLVGYDEIQSYHPVQTPFHIHAPDVLER